MLKYGYETLRRSFLQRVLCRTAKSPLSSEYQPSPRAALGSVCGPQPSGTAHPLHKKERKRETGREKKNAWRTLNSTKSSERAGKKQKRRKNWEDTPACKLMQVTQEHVKKNIRDKWFCNRGQRRCTWWKLARGNRRQSGWDDNKWWRARRMRGQNASKSNPAWAPKSRGDQTCRLFFFFLLLSLITFWRQANATRGNKINTSKKGYSLHTRGGKKKKRDLENTKWPKKKRGDKEAHAST